MKNKMNIHGFDWDKGNIQKCQKHGISIQEVEEILRNSPNVLPNIRHNNFEKRLQAVGITNRKRFGFVIFTFRILGDLHLIRPIRARFMHLKENKHYEKQKE